MLTIIDVSMWQGEVVWSRVKEARIGLAFIKATEGSSSTDPRFERNRAQAERLGIRCGFYLFARPGQSSAIAQADHFCNLIGKLRRRELRPVIDLETGDPHHTEEFARELSRRITRRLGCAPLLYSYSAYLGEMGLRRTIGGGLWLASYNRNDGHDYGAAVPRPWRGWVAHQFTSHGHAPGIAGYVDVSHAPRLRPLLAHPVTGLR